MLDFLLENTFLSSIVAFALVLIPAVVVHEFGHFLAAKAAGITILEFGVGYPPRAVKLFRWGETDFTLNWLPLGGFVRPFGEDMIRPVNEEEAQRRREERTAEAISALSDNQGERDLQPRERAEAPVFSEREELARRGVLNPRSVNDVKPLPRIIFFSAGAIANIIAAFVLFVIIGLIGVEEIVGGRTFFAEVPPQSALGRAGLQQNDFIERVNGEYFESSRDLFRLLATSEQPVILTIRRPDPDARGGSVVFDLPLVIDPAEAQSLLNASGRLLLTAIQEGSPAEAAGLQVGDIIIGLAGESLETSDNPFATLQAINLRHEGVEIPVVLLRDGEQLELPITPRVAPAPGQGHLGAGVIPEFVDLLGGVVYGDAPPQFEYVPLPLGEALTYGASEIGEILRVLAELPIRLLSGSAQPEEGRFVSIVGITQLGNEFLQRSIEDNQPVTILRFIALISIALGITNLLPIPPLDGGRILFVMIEAVRGKPLSPRREEFLLMVGVVFLLSLGVIVIVNDILNPITDLLRP